MTQLFVSLAILAALVLFGLFVFWTEPLWLLPAFERLTPNIVYRRRIRLRLLRFPSVMARILTSRRQCWTSCNCGFRVTVS